MISGGPVIILGHSLNVMLIVFNQVLRQFSISVMVLSILLTFSVLWLILAWFCDIFCQESNPSIPRAYLLKEGSSARGSGTSFAFLTMATRSFIFFSSASLLAFFSFALLLSFLSRAILNLTAKLPSNRNDEIIREMERQVSGKRFRPEAGWASFSRCFYSVLTSAGDWSIARVSLISLAGAKEADMFAGFCYRWGSKDTVTRRGNFRALSWLVL